jgi:hypothetical protein
MIGNKTTPTPTAAEREKAVEITKPLLGWLTSDKLEETNSRIALALADAKTAALELAAQWHDTQAALFQRAAMGDKTNGAGRAAMLHRLHANAIRALAKEPT